MKKWITLSLVIYAGLSAQEKTPETLPPTEESAGAAAVQSTKASSSTRQTWILAGTALALAVVGAIVVSLNSGEEAR